MSTNEELELTLNIKDKTEPLTIRVPSSLTPKEIIEDLQAENQVPKATDRNYAMTHGKTNLQNEVAVGKQGVRDKDAVSVVWDGKLAGEPS